jgi:hypothetical protein
MAASYESMLKQYPDSPVSAKAQRWLDDYRRTQTKLQQISREPSTTKTRSARNQGGQQ